MLRIENGHAHAYTRYSLLGWRDYVLLLKSIVEGRMRSTKSVTVHLPFEIQHREVQNLYKAYCYIWYGQFLKKVFGVKLYWENAPWLQYGTWDLKYTNIEWTYIPYNIELCLDTGHLMLGCKNKEEFIKKLDEVERKRGNQIKHLHLHENDFIADKHISAPGKVVTENIFEKIIKGRTYIVEKGE